MIDPNDQHPTPEEIEAYKREEATWVDDTDICHRCDGTGWVFDDVDTIDVTCDLCGGSGWLS